MVLARFVLLAAFLLAASSVSAAVTIDLGPSDYKNFGSSGAHTGAGIRISFGQTVRLPPLSTNLAVTRNAVVPYASAAARMRPFTAVHPVSAAASAAVTGLFLAMEWYFDEELGEWAVREVENIPPIEGSGWDASFGNCSGYFPTPQAACEAIAVCNNKAQSSVRDIRPTGYPNEFRAVCEVSNPGLIPFVIYTDDITCPPGSDLNPVEGVCQQYVSKPVIEGEFTRLAGELPNLPAEQVAHGTGDAQRRYGMAPGYQDTQITGPSSVAGPQTTTTTTTETGDNIVTNTQTTTNISYGPTTITTTETTTTTTYTNGNHTSTETTTETPGELPVTEPSPGGAAGEWPGFCDWASVVCNFIEWFQEPFDAPEVDWPVIEDQEFEEEFQFSLAAQCPQPYTIQLDLFPAVQFDWQPFCDLAGFIKPLVLASAAIFAAFISLGMRG
ncbi:virulence factor TspB C-terminal domain-related protein [Halopseudomonas pachastrellae]|nr:virulence factor TspB C-terminal domain-related protein [Halopseudomonas pachastrellae]